MLLEYVFHFQAFAHCPVIIVLVESGGGSLAATPSGYGIIMERKTLHTMSYTVHQYICPVVVVVARTAGNLIQAVAVIIAAISGITAVQVCVIFRTHTSTASPTFISYTEIFNFPCFVTAVFAAEICHRRVAVRRHVFHPFGKFLYRTATYISAHVRFATQHFAEIQEFMCTETVVLNRSAPVIINHLRTVCFRADTVHPVIFVGEATARPTENRNSQIL